MISPTNPANPNQDSDKDFHDLLANLANHNKDLAFFKDKCLNILTHQVDWPVDDLTAISKTFSQKTSSTQKLSKNCTPRRFSKTASISWKNIPSY